jgi:hypothetical protein
MPVSSVVSSLNLLVDLTIMAAACETARCGTETPVVEFIVTNGSACSVSSSELSGILGRAGALTMS